MEKTEDKEIVLRQKRNCKECFKEGYSTVTHQSNHLWKFLWPIIIIACIISLTVGIIGALKTPTFTLICTTKVLNTICFGIFLGMLAVIIRKLDELHYIPSVNSWVLYKDILKRSIRGILISAIAVCFYNAMLLVFERYLSSLHLYKYILAGIMLVLSFPYGYISCKLLLTDKGLKECMHEISETKRSFLSFCILWTTTGVCALISIAFCSIPEIINKFICSEIDSVRKYGDIVQIPHTLAINLGVSSCISTFSIYIAFIFLAFPLAFWQRSVEAKD